MIKWSEVDNCYMPKLGRLTILKGDATEPLGQGQKIIAHICNDAGGWGAGFVLAVSSRWSEPEEMYRAWFKSNQRFGLGKTQIVRVTDDICVANMIGQKGYGLGNGPPIKYDAVAKCLNGVCRITLELGASVHMPRIGCGLAGGSWDKIEPLVIEFLCEKGVDVFVYDL